MMVIMIPVLSYSQSKSKYPKQTIINGDSVVILSLQQAIDMNNSFLKIQAQIDSINAVADTLESVVLIKNSETSNLQYKLESSANRLSKYYVRRHRLEVMGEVIVCVSAFALWAIVTNILNTK
jgi:hypothetical protein